VKFTDGAESKVEEGVKDLEENSRGGRGGSGGEMEGVGRKGVASEGREGSCSEAEEVASQGKSTTS